MKKLGHKNSGRRNSTNLGFSCFRAIDKAYRDRSKLELVERKVNTVKHLKEMEDLSLEQVGLILEFRFVNSFFIMIPVFLEQLF